MISPKYATDNYWRRLAMDRTALNSVHKVGSQGKGWRETQLENLDNWFICTACHYSRYPSQQRDVETTALWYSPGLFQNVLCVKDIEMHSYMLACKSGKRECWSLLSSGLISVPFLDQ